jgi:hypothetical protein
LIGVQKTTRRAGRTHATDRTVEQRLKIAGDLIFLVASVTFHLICMLFLPTLAICFTV